MHADAVSTRVREAEATEATINAAREAYRPPPARASALWFVVAELPGLGPMYHTSLTAFRAMFMHCARALAAPRPAAGAAAGAAGGGGGGGGGGGAEALQAQLAALSGLITRHVYTTVGVLPGRGGGGRCRPASLP